MAIPPPPKKKRTGVPPGRKTLEAASYVVVGGWTIHQAAVKFGLSWGAVRAQVERMKSGEIEAIECITTNSI